MDHIFTASQTAVIGVACLAAGIIIGAFLVLHIGGGLVLGGWK